MGRILREVVSVKVSVLGMAEESLASQVAEIDIDEMNEHEVGRVVTRAYRRALSEAVADFAPKLGQKWQGEPDRLRRGD